MAPTNHQEVIALLQQIVGPQFQAIRDQIVDLKETIQINADNHARENERQRDNVADLYTKDREKSAEISSIREKQSQFEGRVLAELAKIEQTLSNIQDTKKNETESKRFTTSQWITIAGILAAAIVGTVGIVLTLAK